LAFKDLNKFIQQDDVDKIWEKMKEITYMTFSSVKRKINPNARKNCFEIFGLDFIIDD
jgi:tubulin--tyrosine ligase